MAAGGSQQRTYPSYRSLEYLKDASQISIQAAWLEGNKYLLLLAENSITHCCTVQGSPDVVIRDRTHAHIRFCISGAALGLPVIKSYVQSKYDKIGKIKNSNLITQSRVHGTIKAEVATTDDYRYVYFEEETHNRKASITVNIKAITLRMDVCLPTSVKALLISYAVMLALSRHRNKVVDFMGPPLSSEECARLLPVYDTCDALPISERGIPTEVDSKLPQTSRLILRPFLTNKDHSKYSFVLMNPANNNEVCMTLVYYKGSSRLDCIEPFGSVTHSAKGFNDFDDEMWLYVSATGHCRGIAGVIPKFQSEEHVVKLENIEREDLHPNRILKFVILRKYDQYSSYPIINLEDEEIVRFTACPTHLTLEMLPNLLPNEMMLCITFSLKYILNALKNVFDLPCLQVDPFTSNYFAYSQWYSNTRMHRFVNRIFEKKNFMHVRASAAHFANKVFYLDVINPVRSQNDLQYKVKCHLDPTLTELVSADVISRDGAYTLFRVNYFKHKKLITVFNEHVGDIGGIDHNSMFDRNGTELTKLFRLTPKGEGSARYAQEKFVSYKNYELFCTIRSIYHASTLSISSKREEAGWVTNILFLAYTIKESFSTYNFSQIPVPHVSVYPNRGYLDDSDLEED